MDAFYASCELLRYPQLKGLPVVIGGGRRKEDDLLAKLQAAYPDGEWTEATFAERLDRIPVDFFPAHRGLHRARRDHHRHLCGAAVRHRLGHGADESRQAVPAGHPAAVDFERYRHFSRTFKSIITDIAPVMQDRGVDEVYIDFTEVPGGQREGGRVLARLIQKSIFEATGLTCSVGVAPNKLIAKMGQRVQQAERHICRARGRPANPHLAAGLPQDQRRGPQGR